MQALIPPIDDAAWALFLDIDCTLLDLAPTPAEVVVPDWLHGLLTTLTRKCNGALALVSGRSLNDIDRMFPGLRDAAGTHGAEWRLGGVVSTFSDPLPEALIGDIKTQLKPLPGVVLERKRRSAALHFRSVPEQEDHVHRVALAAMRRSGVPLRLVPGKAVFEIVPEGVNKGHAIDYFMRCRPYAGRIPIFAGDDVTDEAGFAVVNRMGGISIHVGLDKATEAPLRIPSPESFRQWLIKFNQSLKGQSDDEHA